MGFGPTKKRDVIQTFPESLGPQGESQPSGAHRWAPPSFLFFFFFFSFSLSFFSLLLISFSFLSFSLSLFSSSAAASRAEEKAERRPGKAGRRRLVRWLGAAAVGSAACHQVAAGQEEAGVTARDTAGWRVLQRCGLGRGGAARLVHGSACAGHGARPGGGRAWRLPGVGSAWATPVKTVRGGCRPGGGCGQGWPRPGGVRGRED